MGNGFSDKEMIEMLLKGQQGIQEQLALLGEKVDSVMYRGCAHREGDLLRIANLEGWKNRGIGGVILSLLSALGALTVAIVGHLTGGK
jgi:hypothetical protein